MSDDSDHHKPLFDVPTAHILERGEMAKGAGAALAHKGAFHDDTRRAYCKHVLASLISPAAQILDDEAPPPGENEVRASQDELPQIRLNIRDPFVLDAYAHDLENMISSDTGKLPRLEQAVTDAVNILRHYYSMNEKNARAARRHLSMPENMKPWLGIRSAAEPITYQGKLQSVQLMIHMPKMEDLRDQQRRWQYDSANLAAAVDHGLLEMVDAADRHVCWNLPTGYGRA